MVSSETCALDVVGAEFIRDVEPGEIVTIDHHGLRSSEYSHYKRHEMCAMEYIYFARPDSDIEGCNVHAFRRESGRLLWEESPAEADIVVGVPDSSLSAAIGYAEASGIPYEMGLIKNKYIGRTFIQPSQTMREKGVRMKLSAVKSLVRGKRVVLIDDSVVRGTTSQRIVRMLREAGATEVHMRIASPPITNPCYYGVDSDGVVLVHLERQFEFGAHAVGAAHQHRFPDIQCREVEHSAERTDIAHHTGAGRRCHMFFDASHHFVSGLEIHAGSFITFCHTIFSFYLLSYNAVGYRPVKQARHSSLREPARNSASFDRKHSESAPIVRHTSSTVRDELISSSRVDMSTP